jgi:hypothetical protein
MHVDAIEFHPALAAVAQFTGNGKAEIRRPKRPVIRRLAVTIWRTDSWTKKIVGAAASADTCKERP